MLRELANEFVDLQRRSEFGSIDPIVQRPEHIENGRRYFENSGMLRTGWNNDRDQRIAPGRDRSLQSIFENRADVVTAAKKNDFRMQTNALDIGAGRMDALQTARYAQTAIDRQLRLRRRQRS